MATKTVYIELTEEQKEKLFPLFDKLAREGDPEEKTVMLLAQIHTTGRDAVAACRIIDHEKSLKIQAVFSEKLVGKTVGYKGAEKRLAKARAK